MDSKFDGRRGPRMCEVSEIAAEIIEQQRCPATNGKPDTIKVEPDGVLGPRQARGLGRLQPSWRD